MRLYQEALVVGVICVVIGTLVGALVGSVLPSDLPEVCREWNKYHAMEISLFLTGVVAHYAFELFGANRWYCENGVACQA